MAGLSIEDLLKALANSDQSQGLKEALAEQAGTEREKMNNASKDAAAGRAVQLKQLALQGKNAADQLKFNYKELEYRKENDATDRTWKTGEREGTQTWQTGEREGEQTWKTGERLGEQLWRSGESAADRAWRTGERLGEQSFKAGENAADRSMTKYDIDTRADIAAKDLAAKYKAMEIDQGKAKADAWYQQQQVRLHEDEIGMNYAKQVTEYASSPDKNYFRMLDYQAQPGAMAGRNYLAGLMNQQATGFGTWGGTPETNSFTRDMADAGIDPNTMRSWEAPGGGEPAGWSDVDLTPPPVSSTGPVLGPPIYATGQGPGTAGAAPQQNNFTAFPAGGLGPYKTLEAFKAAPEAEKQALKAANGYPPRTTFSTPAATPGPALTPGAAAQGPAVNYVPFPAGGLGPYKTLAAFQAAPEAEKQSLKAAAGLPPRTSFGSPSASAVGVPPAAAPAATTPSAAAPAPTMPPATSKPAAPPPGPNGVRQYPVVSDTPAVNYVPFPVGGLGPYKTLAAFQAAPEAEKQALKQQAGLPPRTSFGSPSAHAIGMQPPYAVAQGGTGTASGAQPSANPIGVPASAAAAAAIGAPGAPAQPRGSGPTAPMGNYGDVAASLSNEGLVQQIQGMIQNASNEVAQATVKAMRGAGPNERWAQGTAQTGLADRRAKIEMLNAELQRRGLQPVPVPATFGDPAYASDAVKAGLGSLRSLNHGDVPLPDWATPGTPGGGQGQGPSGTFGRAPTDPLLMLTQRHQAIQAINSLEQRMAAEPNATWADYARTHIAQLKNQIGFFNDQLKTKNIAVPQDTFTDLVGGEGAHPWAESQFDPFDPSKFVPASGANAMTHIPDRATFIQQHNLQGWGDADVDNLMEGAKLFDRGFGKIGAGQWEGMGEAKQNLTMAAASRLGYDPQLLEDDWKKSRFIQGSAGAA